MAILEALASFGDLAVLNDDLIGLRQRIDLLGDALAPIRDRLRDCLQVTQPRNALTLARSVAESLTKTILKDAGLRPSTTLDACISQLESPAIISRGWVPAEIITLLHMARVLGNKAAHDVMKIEATAADVGLVVRSVLRVVEWYFAEFERGPKVNPLFRDGPLPPPLRIDQLLPQVGMPSLVCVSRRPDGTHRKVFLFTERLVGFGREKPSRDPRIHIVTRLLPCPGPEHPNWAANLEHVGRFHAQLWWDMGRAQIRDENSESGVLLDDRPIGPGIWTSCSKPHPARVRLGQGGVEFEIHEVVRSVGRVAFPCLRLMRIGNWPFHEYVIVGRPFATVGSDVASVVWFPDVSPQLATLTATERGWVIKRPDGSEEGLADRYGESLLGGGVTVCRTSEGDFLD